MLSDTKRDMGKCHKKKGDNFIEEFKNHPRREELTRKYERLLYAELKEIIGDAERWKDREQVNIRATKGKIDEGKRKVAQAMREEASKLMEEATTLAEDGNVEESKKKMEAAAALKDQAEKNAEPAEEKKESVCMECGVRMDEFAMESGSHYKGRLHQAYTEMRKRHQEIKEKMDAEDRKPRTEKDTSSTVIQ